VIWSVSRDNFYEYQFNIITQFAPGGQPYQCSRVVQRLKALIYEAGIASSFVYLVSPSAVSDINIGPWPVIFFCDLIGRSGSKEEKGLCRANRLEKWDADDVGKCWANNACGHYSSDFGPLTLVQCVRAWRTFPFLGCKLVWGYA
jgi:hypothetical protein